MALHVFLAGGMRPNILVLGFYDDCCPQDNLQDGVFTTGTRSLDRFGPAKAAKTIFHFPAVRADRAGSESGSAKDLSVEEYVYVIADAVKMQKSVALARYFSSFNRSEVLAKAKPGHSGLFVDVWPLNLLRPDNVAYVDTCSLFLLQLACVLHMSHAWHQARLRLFLCVETGSCLEEAKEKLQRMLKDLRITADVYTVPWDHVVGLHGLRKMHGGGQIPKMAAEDGKAQSSPEVNDGGAAAAAAECVQQNFPSNTTLLSDDFLCAVNLLIRENGDPPPAVRFLYLPRPPADTRRYSSYLHQLDLLSQDLGPTLLIHGVTPVITTAL